MRYKSSSSNSDSLSPAKKEKRKSLKTEDNLNPLKVRKLQAAKVADNQQKSSKKEEVAKIFKKEIKISQLGKDLQNLESPERHLTNNDSLKLLRNDSQVPLQSFLQDVEN